MRQPCGEPTAAWCRRQGFGPGTRLVGEATSGAWRCREVVEITAVGRGAVLATVVERHGRPVRDPEAVWSFAEREWELHARASAEGGTDG